MMLMNRCLVLLLLLGSAAAVQAQPPRNYTLTQITGNYYRGSTGIWHSLVYVTDEGILLVDTLTPDYATWLKQKLAEQFPGKAVKYLIYTHSHWDHVEGGAAFADTATFIGHSNMLLNMDGRYPNMPGDMIDRNGNGMIDREDIMIPTEAAPGICGMGPGFFDQIDRDHNGITTPGELQQNIVPPSVTYEDTMTLPFGGQNIQLIHPGRNHANDMTVVFFPEARLLFSADYIADALVRDSLLSLPSACGPFDGHALQEWIDGYRKIEALAFDKVTTAHGAPLTFDRSDVTATREYFEYLQATVRQAIADGLTLEQMKATLLLDPYQGWANYTRLREMNIEAAYHNLMLFPGD